MAPRKKKSQPNQNSQNHQRQPNVVESENSAPQNFQNTLNVQVTNQTVQVQADNPNGAQASNIQTQSQNNAPISWAERANLNPKPIVQNSRPQTAQPSQNNNQQAQRPSSNHLNSNGSNSNVIKYPQQNQINSTAGQNSTCQKNSNNNQHRRPSSSINNNQNKQNAAQNVANNSTNKNLSNQNGPKIETTNQINKPQNNTWNKINNNNASQNTQKQEISKNETPPQAAKDNQNNSVQKITHVNQPTISTKQQTQLSNQPTENQSKSGTTNQYPSVPQRNIDGEFPQKYTGPYPFESRFKTIQLKANHYFLNPLSKPITVYQYAVSIFTIDRKTNKKLECTKKEIIRSLYERFMEKNKNLENKVAYDFRKLLFSLIEIPIKSYTFDCDRKNYTIELEFSKQLLIDQSNICDADSIQFIQLAFTHNFTKNLYSIRRSFFIDSKELRIQLGFSENLELWKGFFVSARPSERGLSINFDVSNAVFTTPGLNILDIACQFFRCERRGLEEKFQNLNNTQKFMRFISNKKVKTEMGYTKKVQETKDYKYPSAVNHKFREDENNASTLISVYDYFKKKNKILAYPKLPCLYLGGKNYTPMEMCVTVMEHQAMEKLEPKIQGDMVRKATTACPERKQFIEKLLANSGLQTDPILSSLNISIQSNMAQVKGLVLEAPQLEYQGNKIIKDIKNAGRWRNENNKFLLTKENFSWVLVNCSYAKKYTIDSLTKSIKTKSVEHGVKMEDSLAYVDYGENPIDEKLVRNFLINIKTKHNPDLIFAVTCEPLFYKLVKTMCDLELGIATQFINETTVSKNGLDSTVSNVMLKINTKLGGTNFKLSAEDQLFKEQLSKFYNEPVMIIGADVLHCQSSDRDSSESIAAVVASIDKNWCYYPARMLIQKEPKKKSLETIFDLHKLLEPLLRLYFERNGRFPLRLIYIRDGVSEGQFKEVKQHEMSRIREACLNIHQTYQPGVTFIVTQKRHHTRFFPDKIEYRGDKPVNNGNVPPGTLVDSVITKPNINNPFICSHLGIQGTSKPCHYNLLHDENNFQKGQWELLCHYLCHIFCRSTTAVSYPAPTYYADLCAGHAKEYIRKTNNQKVDKTTSELIKVSEKLENTMFYI